MPAWVAPAIGAAAGVASSLFGGGKEETEQEMPGYMENSFRQYYDRLGGGEMSGSPGFWKSYAPKMYEDNMMAQQSPFTKMAIRRMGNFNNKRSQNYYKDVVKGDYLGLNPAMQGAVMNPAIERTNAAFNQMGRFGSQANMENTAEAGMSALMPYYNAERARMGQAAQALPQMKIQRNQQNLQGGQLRDSYRQRRINEDISRHDFKQNNWLNRMQSYQGLLNPGYNAGGTTTMNTPGQNPIQGAMGGALMGASLYNNWPGSGTTTSGVNPYNPQPTGMPANMDMFNEWGLF